jgi:hypothetical protein
LLTHEWFADKRAAHVTFQGELGNALAFAAAPFDDARGRDAGSVTVLTRADDFGTGEFGPFIHAATLVASDAAPGDSLGSGMTASGRRVAALSAGTASGVLGGAIYIFELPDPLPEGRRVFDTFEDMNAAGWTPQGNTDWRVVASGGSQVFRQANMQGDARAVFDGFEGTDQ